MFLLYNPVVHRNGLPRGLKLVLPTMHVEWYWRPLGRLALWWWKIPRYK